MPLVLDSNKELGPAYKVTSFPTMFVVGKTGVVEAVHVGAAAGFEKTIAQEIDTLLSGKTRADFPGAKAAASAPHKSGTPVALKKLPVTKGKLVVPANKKNNVKIADKAKKNGNG